jgi:hypothetical protein
MPGDTFRGTVLVKPLVVNQGRVAGRIFVKRAKIEFLSLPVTV